MAKLVGDNRVRAFSNVLFDQLGAAVALVVLSPIIGATALDGSRSEPRFARFVRRTRLDELPQLINILRGEMSSSVPGR